MISRSFFVPFTILQRSVISLRDFTNKLSRICFLGFSLLMDGVNVSFFVWLVQGGVLLTKSSCLTFCFLSFVVWSFERLLEILLVYWSYYNSWFGN